MTSRLATVTPLEAAPLPPQVRLPFLQRIAALRNFDVGAEKLRDAGGWVCQVTPPLLRGLVPRVVLVSSPQGAHDVLGGFDGSLDKGMMVHVQNRLWGPNLFNMPHETWQPRRRVLQPVFTKKHVASYVGRMATEAEHAAADWTRRAQIDLDQRARELTLQVLGRSVLGLDLGPRADALAPHIERVATYAMRRSTRPVRAPAWLPTPARARFRRSLGALQAVSDEAIAQCHSNPDEAGELVQAFLAAADPETGRPLDDEAIRDDLIAFLFAGHDTTATTLAYSLWALGRHPELQDRVAGEVRQLGDRPLTVADVPSLGYTVQVLHEALRLCPPGAGVGRLAVRDVVIDGHRIPAGTNLVVSIIGLHRDPALWDDPLRFDPDRFAPEHAHGRDRWQYLPFGAGPRSCIGDHFAMLEATIGLASIVRAVRVESLEPEFPTAFPFTMTAGAPIPARISARS